MLRLLFGAGGAVLLKSNGSVHGVYEFEKGSHHVTWIEGTWSARDSDLILADAGEGKRPSAEQVYTVEEGGLCKVTMVRTVKNPDDHRQSCDHPSSVWLKWLEDE